MTREPVVLTANQWTLLADAHARYKATVSPTYDDVLNEVVARTAASGSIGKADMGALLFWKRLRADTPWVGKIHGIADLQVRAHTARAMDLVNDAALSLSDAAGAGRSALTPLPGFVIGDAMASAVLLAMAPGRMAVYDRRGHAGLTQLGVSLSNRSGRYSRFMQIIDDLIQGQPEFDQPWIPRDADIALFQLGGDKKSNL